MQKMWWIAIAVVCVSLGLDAQEQPTPPTEQNKVPAASLEVTPASIQEETPDEAQHLIKKVQLEYPDKAEDRGIEGPVVLHVSITKKGKVKGVKVVSGNPLLAKAAVKAVRKWQYQPFLREGDPADAERDVTITFKLHSAGDFTVCPGQEPLYSALWGKDRSAPFAPVNGPAAPARVGGGVSAPRATYDPEPEYSERARRAKYSGVVLLWLVVGADGKVHDIRVTRRLGRGLDEQALEAVCQWRFEPSMRDGKPVAVQINVEVTFHLY